MQKKLKIDVICAHCENLGNDPIIFSSYTSKKVANDEKNSKNPGSLTWTCAMEFLQTGKNDAGIEQFAMIMNMLPFSKSSFVEYELSSVAIKKIESILDEACAVVKNTYTRLPTNQSSLEDCVNITVSYDGTWLPRGHTSKFGIGCVIDGTTGYVIDYEVMWKYCHPCTTAREELGKDTPEFNFWMEVHMNECNVNHSGSSGSMEMALEILWRRSDTR